MIYLLHGSDTAKSLEKLKNIIAEFREKNGGDLDIHRFDAEENGPEEIKKTLETRSLFSAKKLVVMKYFSTSRSKDELRRILERTKGDPQTTVILWDRELAEKDLVWLKALCKKTQEFNGMKREMSAGANIFQLGDTFFSSPIKGLYYLLGMLHGGYDDFNIFSYLLNHARTISLVKYYMNRREPAAAKHGIHPFVVKKAENIARLLPEDAPVEMLKVFFEEDCHIKIGLSRPRDSLIKVLFQKI